MGKKINLKEVWPDTIEAHTKEQLTQKVMKIIDQIPDEFEYAFLNLRGMVRVKTVATNKKKITRQDVLNIKAYAKLVELRLNIFEDCKKTCQNSNCNPDTCQTFQKRLAEESARQRLSFTRENRLNKPFVLFDKTFYNQLFKRISLLLKI